MTLILDLDHLLIRTEGLKVKMFELVRPLGVTRKIFNETYQATAHRAKGKYSYSAVIHGEKTAAALKKPGLALEITKRLYQAIEQTPNLVYGDVFDFLAKARKSHARLILLTRGDPDWQMRKIKAAGLKRFFDQIIITPADKKKKLRALVNPVTPRPERRGFSKELIKNSTIPPWPKGLGLPGSNGVKNQAAYLITDNAQEIERLRKIKITILQLIRPDGKYREKARGVNTVQTLKQAWAMIAL